ncbi:unnamed protein product [Lymnaea stagnalis]|uniref:Arrestin-like N-terminal domain-containing protein n=1 Tax=Lymnaea stagnalis TaxID=6523 RepID=A0AAV2IJJ1_LYMST
MNNEIALRTGKGEYMQGETVYGAVYLNICTPTEANGIQVSFKGIETCIYEYEYDGRKTLKNETIHINFSNVDLYSQTEFFQFGCYVFPFKFDLPKTIPGTFKYKGAANGSAWDVDVSYLLQAHAVKVDGIQASQKLIVYQAKESECKDSHVGSANDVSFKPSLFSLTGNRIHITIKLLENFVETGSNMQLRLIVTNQSKVHVSGFTIKLLRYLKLYMRGMEMSDHVVPKKSDSKVLQNMEFSENKLHIAPEFGPHQVYSMTGSFDALMVGNCSSGLDRLQIPLQENLDDIPPTVEGKHVKNQYGVEVIVRFNNGHTETVNLKIPGVLPRKNLEWGRWTPPDWTFRAETKLSTSLFSVSELLLRTEAFSGLPAFQVL